MLHYLIPMRFRFLLVFVALAAVSCSGRKIPVTDWDSVISGYRDDETRVDYLKVAELNLALAMKGRLAEDMFCYTQAGAAGLIPEWNRTEEVGELASDIFYAVGHVAYAQRMAFEANVLGEETYNPRMMCRLIETNLLYGAYDVAEKYISILRGDGYVFPDYSRFLYNDAAVAADPVFGDLLKCIPSADRIALEDGIENDLAVILRANPQHRITMEYLGAYYLLDCNMDAFRSFLDEFYGTEALPSLPRSFAEAACMLSELEKGYWKTVGVDKKIYERYRDFKSRLENGLSEAKYKNTFWYYIMRANSQ